MMKVGVLGATSPAGRQAINMLVERGVEVVAFSRKPQPRQEGVQWRDLSKSDAQGNAKTEWADVGVITHWIVLSHIWVLAEYFEMLQALGAKRVVCISSTSRFTKTESDSEYENALVDRLEQGETAVQKWAEASHIGWTVLRPTLIYGRSTDRNLSEIVRFISRFHVFPLLGQAKGLRQPVYVDDVASAAVLALLSENSLNKAYNISGAEKISYREMVNRIFRAMRRKPLVLPIPLWSFRLALRILNLIPRYRHWNDQMVVRMNQDMVFDHADAARDFGFSPQSFILHERDVQEIGSENK